MDHQDTDQADVQKFAAAPFDEETADIILRTSDKVDFRVYSIILSLASPFFKDTFSLPQTEPRQPDANVIDLSEDSVVLDKVLRFCYPVQDPTFKNAKRLSPVIDAMGKYTMDEVLGRARRALSDFTKEDPVRVFAIAYRYRWEDIAGTAVKHILEHPFPRMGTYIDELDHIPTKTYHLLVDYYRRCSDAACSTTESPLCHDNVTVEWWSDYPCDRHEVQWSFFEGDCESRDSRTWFRTFMLQLTNEIRQRPSPNTVGHNPWIIESALEEASGCPECQLVAYQHFRAWVEDELTPSIAQAVDAVPLLLNF